nr:MAG TPA_asm: hypothetical protein [Caudoviricetes sp.]
MARVAPAKPKKRKCVFAGFVVLWISAPHAHCVSDG